MTGRSGDRAMRLLAPSCWVIKVIVLCMVCSNGHGFAPRSSTSRPSITFMSLAPPTMGIGSVLFKPRGMKIKPSLGNQEDLYEAGDFFTDAFWTAKVGGGAKELSQSQKKSLLRQQTAEFRRR
eukprot:CAMPEP_0198299186 /NCGR_PEP_ID=MMETSP1449-20131203/43800_1 /TAXON_ID=420275 /ORGANISM="Attheya septentrionalis, Strain CCMP2084" /LENGTH=122 /DNA_ID=CAMNT_0044000665 /DNA_START=104 /DNA_END=469 /DNA_ORIENTATION=-